MRLLGALLPAALGLASLPVWAVKLIDDSANSTADSDADSGAEPVLGEWVKLPDYPLGVQESQGTLMSCGDNVTVHIVVGGFIEDFKTTFEGWKRDVSDDTNEWEAIAPMPDSAGHPLTHMAQAVSNVPEGLGDTLFLAGGYLGDHPGPSSTAAFSFHCPSNNWTILPDLPAQRAGGGLVHLQDENAIVFAGGVERHTQGDEPNSPITTLEDHGTTWMLDLDNVTAGWVDLGIEMPNPRNHQAGVDACGQLLWIGGQHEDDEEEGNQVTNNKLEIPKGAAGVGASLKSGPGAALGETLGWGTIADLQLPVGHVSASSMVYNCGVLVVAGITQQRLHTDEVQYWDHVANTWSVIGAYPTGTATPVCGIWKDFVYCATGSNTKIDSYKASLA